MSCRFGLSWHCQRLEGLRQGNDGATTITWKQRVQINDSRLRIWPGEERP